MVATAGFFAGVRVQKSRRARRHHGHRGRSDGGGGPGGPHRAPAPAAARGSAGGRPGAAGRRGTVGLVTAVEGTSLLITDSTGNTVKVTTIAASRITKTDAATIADIHPGDVVVIIGTKAADGTTAATAITLGGVSPPAPAGRGHRRRDRYRRLAGAAPASRFSRPPVRCEEGAARASGSRSRSSAPGISV